MLRPSRLIVPLILVASAAPVRADGVMVVQDRALMRQGAPARAYCSDAGSGGPAECDRVLTKVLSGYSYGRGWITGGAVARASSVGGLGAASGFVELHVDVAAAALPGGDLSVAAFEGVIGDAAARRVRFTLFDGQNLFLCRDRQSGDLALPVWGMFTHACNGDAVLGVDLGLLAAQWDIESGQLAAEWARLGPAVELLGNGLGYAHLLRSLSFGLPLDVRSIGEGGAVHDGGTSLGVGLRVATFVRSPQWETRLTGRYRTALLGGAGTWRDHAVSFELRVLRNFFVSDAVVLQAGLSLRGSFSQRPEASFVTWVAPQQRWSGFAGLHLGWVHEAPGI